MIDLHCHLLAGIDDGAKDIEQSLAMARIAVSEGITVVACTPHITPGVYNNDGGLIKERLANLRQWLSYSNIPLSVVCGADIHVAPNIVDGLKSGAMLSLNDSRYVLIEPPHHVAPPQLEQSFFQLISAGYVPILTHPERLSWIDRRYDLIQQLAQAGVWMQITAGSLTGTFGSRPKYWAERMLDEGLVQIMATDAHNTGRRGPYIREALDLARERVGEAEAANLTLTRPRGILENAAPGTLFVRARRNSVKTGAGPTLRERWRLLRTRM
jgi:protein-tyrosine phosphatase